MSWGTVQHAWAWAVQHWNPLLTFLVALAALATAITTYLQVRVSQRQLRLSQRAWLTVKSVTFDGYNSVGKQPHITIVLQNTGPTPANQVITSIASMKQTSPRLTGVMPALDWTDPQYGAVGPSATVTYYWGYSERDPGQREPHPYVLTEEDMEDLRLNRLFLFVYGETRYIDIFDYPHRTQWAWYNPNPHGNEPRTRQANTWNDAR